MSATHIAGLALPRADVNAHVVALNKLDVATDAAAKTVHTTYMTDAADVRKANLKAYDTAAAAATTAVSPAISPKAAYDKAVAAHTCSKS